MNNINQQSLHIKSKVSSQHSQVWLPLAYIYIWITEDLNFLSALFVWATPDDTRRLLHTWYSGDHLVPKLNPALPQSLNFLFMLVAKLVVFHIPLYLGLLLYLTITWSFSDI